MARALRLARRGMYTAHPNPRVGCVIVKDGQIVGEGWHRKTGEAHAEVVALDSAGANAKEATVYVTLEPCSHEGKTPPCVDALIAAGVSSVIAAMDDPNAKVSGDGRGALENAGIQVRNSIILVDFIELRMAQGLSLKEACIDAGVIRFRPMVLTAAAVIVGGAVILFDPIFQGLAVALIGGAFAAPVLSRVAVPRWTTPSWMLTIWNADMGSMIAFRKVSS